MPRNRRERRHPRLFRVADGYSCDELDKILERNSLSLEGLEAHIIGPCGSVLNTVTVGYPVPAELTYPWTTKNGREAQIRVNLIELWLEFNEKDQVHPFAYYDCRYRLPTAHLKVDH